MKKLFILFQWAFVIAFALFALRMWTRPVPPPERHPETWSSWDGFSALSIAGVSRTAAESYVTRDQLAGFLEALQGAGYQTIWPEDALAFLEGRHPLPDQAVLLMFEGGRKDSYVHTTPVLRQAGAVATLAVPTRLVENGSRFYLRPRDLARIAREPHWRLASMGHRAHEARTVGPDRTARFLTTRRDAAEGDEAYRARVLADFAEARRYLARAGATEPVAYLLPFADAGTGPGSDPLAGPAITDALAAQHALAFTRADEIFNGPFRDPRQLSRVRMDGTWTPDRLLAALQASRPRLTGVEGFADPSAWTGSGEVSGEQLTLSTGALAWVKGSEGWSDVEVSFACRPATGGAVSVYVRHAGPHRYLRLRVAPDGVVLQEKLGSQAQTLFSSGRPTDRDHHYSVRTRGNRVWVFEDDTALAGPLPVTRGTARGRIGLEAEGGPAIITRFAANPQYGPVALSDRGWAGVPPGERDRVRRLVVPWFDTRRPVTVSEDQRLDLLLAAAEGVEVIPSFQGGEELDAAAAGLRAAEVEQALDHLITRPLVRRLAVADQAGPLADALRARGYGVVRWVEADQERNWTPDDRSARAGQAWIMLNARPAFAGESNRWLSLAPADQLAVEVDQGTTLPPGVRRVVRYP